MLPADFEQLKDTIINTTSSMFDASRICSGDDRPGAAVLIDKVGRLNIPVSLRESVGLSTKESRSWAPATTSSSGAGGV